MKALSTCSRNYLDGEAGSVLARRDTDRSALHWQLSVLISRIVVRCMRRSMLNPLR